MRGELAHRSIDENRLRVGVVNDVGDLIGREVGVDGGVVQPGKLATPGDFEELLPIGQDQGHAVAGAQPGIMQDRGDPLASGIQLAVRDRAAVE